MIKDHDENSWLPNIIKSVASENIGIEEIANEIERHKNYLIKKNLLKIKREMQSKVRVKEIVEYRLKSELWSVSGENSLNSFLEKAILGNLSPYHIAENILEEFKNRI